MSEARITIKGWSMECSSHNYITLYFDGRFVHCFDNNLHIENSPKDEYYTEHIIATIERRTKMKITDIPIIMLKILMVCGSYMVDSRKVLNG